MRQTAIGDPEVGHRRIIYRSSRVERERVQAPKLEMSDCRVLHGKKLFFTN